MTVANIYLYSTLNPASDKARAFLNKKKINFTDLCYRDEEQHPEVFAPIRTWFPDGSFDSVNDFPFIIYDDEDGKKQFITDIPKTTIFDAPLPTANT